MGGGGCRGWGGGGLCPMGILSCIPGKQALIITLMLIIIHWEAKKKVHC